MSHTLFSIDGLTKRYGETVVVDRLSFGIAPGECLGVIGPNGAGKTTTIRMCLGLTAPDAGEISFFPDVQGKGGTTLKMPRDALAIKEKLGIVSQFDSLDP
ncbi:MAG: transporter related protein, partial [Polaromonas sp.]|nr:transporter related protein [Polaromonas sp.]